MTRTRALTAGLAAGLLAIVSLPTPLGAQSREQQQMFADLRILEEQVQQMRLTVNTLAEQVKTAIAALNGRLDDQAAAARKTSADLTLLMNNVASTVGTLHEKVADNSITVQKLTSELDAIRKGIEMLTTFVTQALPGATSSAGAPPAAGGGAAPVMPPSPGTYWEAAWGYYTIGQYDLAIEAFRDYLLKFPDSVDAPRAQFFIGESYYRQTPTKCREAVAAYDVLIKNENYKGSDYVPNAYLAQGLCYEELKQKDLAIKNWQAILQRFPTSSAAFQATQNLKRIGAIKQ
jgi:TolA-binding protein